MGNDTGAGAAHFLQRQHHAPLALATRFTVITQGNRPRAGGPLLVVFGVVVAGIVDGASHGRKLPFLPVGAILELAQAVAAALDEGLGDRGAVERMRPAMATFLARADDVLTPTQCSGVDGGAAGHVLHEDPAGRFHIISVVFPPGTSSGVHEHGCWGVIGYVRGLDEEATYRRVDGGDGATDVRLEKVAEVTHRAGEISRLLPPDEMFHRVRNPGTEDGVSVHVLCMGAETHPHRYWDRDSRRLLPFPFRKMDGGVVRAEVVFDS